MIAMVPMMIDKSSSIFQITGDQPQRLCCEAQGVEVPLEAIVHILGAGGDASLLPLEPQTREIASCTQSVGSVHTNVRAI